MDILATSIPTVKRIPQQCRVAVAKAYTTVMSRCASEGTVDHSMRAWKLMFLFSKCVLRQQPEVRGGKKKKLKRNESLRIALLERLVRWNEGKVDVLWAEACKLYVGRSEKASGRFAEPRSVPKTHGMVKQWQRCSHLAPPLFPVTPPNFLCWAHSRSDPF